MTVLLIESLRALAEGSPVLIVGLSEADARERGRRLLRAAKALGIAVRGRTRDLDAPTIRVRAFAEPPAGHANAYDGFIDPACVFERGNVRDGSRSVTA